MSYSYSKRRKLIRALKNKRSDKLDPSWHKEFIAKTSSIPVERMLPVLYVPHLPMVIREEGI